LEIRVDDLEGAQVIAMLQEHLSALRRVSPPESCHVLDLPGLRRPDITFWTVWDGDQLAGCGALKELTPQHGEIKSMRTATSHLRKGVASQLLRYMIAEAKRRNYRRLSLETGSMAYFDAARALYASFGFVPCAPFGNYIEDPNSVFMVRDLK
jgi:putative acetyltransferase